MLTQSRVKEILNYDRETGVLSCRVDRWMLKVGDVVGNLMADGYLRLSIDGRTYKAHRVIWLWMTGEWPKKDIDHVDLNRSNNCWKNLRVATKSQGGANRRRPANNTSGLKGVCLLRSGRWQSAIKVNGRNIYLGLFDCPVAAHLSYVVAAGKYFGEYARAA